MSFLRPLLCGLVTGTLLLGAALPRAPISDAHATVALLHPLSELVDLADRVVVATPTERFSRWEQLHGRRIVSYTKITVDRRVYGPAADTLWVRTLGGAVDGVGQHVAGQPRLDIGQRALLFLQPDGPTLVVTGAAQGHFPVRIVRRDKKATAVLAASPSQGKLVRRPGPSVSAQQALVDRALADAVKIIQQARRSRDAARQGK